MGQWRGSLALCWTLFFNNGLRLDDVTHGRWPRCVDGGRRRPEVSLPGHRSWGAGECREVEKGLASAREARLAPPCFEEGHARDICCELRPLVTGSSTPVTKHCGSDGGRRGWRRDLSRHWAETRRGPISHFSVSRRAPGLTEHLP
jgi:hypothetical protein